MNTTEISLLIRSNKNDAFANFIVGLNPIKIKAIASDAIEENEIDSLRNGKAPLVVFDMPNNDISIKSELSVKSAIGLKDFIQANVQNVIKEVLKFIEK